MKSKALTKTNQKHRLNRLAKNVKTVFFYIKLELFNMQNKRFPALLFLLLARLGQILQLLWGALSSVS
jgi:hypothetical protein